MNEVVERERQAYEDGRRAGRQNEPDSIPYYEDLNLDALWDKGYSDGKRDREEWEANERRRYEERETVRLRAYEAKRQTFPMIDALTIANNIRAAFDWLKRTSEGKLKSFPNECCDTACSVLGLHLYDFGFRNIVEKLGVVAPGVKHRWLEVGSVVVDITADQFGQPAVVVDPDSAWHKSLSVNSVVEFDEAHYQTLTEHPWKKFTREIYAATAARIAANNE